MSPQGSGSGKTPDRLVKMLSEAVSKSSQSAVARETGLTQSAIGRYIKGIGEPSTATLQKLADYFVVSVAWLRGDTIDNSFTLENIRTINLATRALEQKHGVSSETTQILGASDNLLKAIIKAGEDMEDLLEETKKD